MRYLVCLLLTLLSFQSIAQFVDQTEQQKVKIILHDFIKATLDYDYDRAKKLCTKQSYKRIDEIEEFASMNSDSEKERIEKKRKDLLFSNINFKTIIFDDDLCTVGISLSNNPKFVESFELIKRNNTWLVDLESTYQKVLESSNSNKESKTESSDLLSEDRRIELTSEAKEVVSKFFKLIAFNKFEDAKRISTQKTREMLSIMKVQMSMVPDSMLLEMEQRMKEAQNAKLSFKDIIIESNTCEVKFTSSNRAETAESIFLKRVNNKWLVAIEIGMPQAEEASEAVE